MSRKPSANVVDNSLVLSLPNAVNPVVWRMELAKAKMSALEIREDKLGDFTLILKTPKGDSSEIARFAQKNDALKGLNAISLAMRKAEKDEAKGTKSSSLLKKTLIAIASIFGVVLTFIILLNIIIMISGASLPTTGDMASTSGAAAIEDGVPQSADDFLRAR